LGGRLGALNGRDGHVPVVTQLCAPTPRVGRGTSRAEGCFSGCARLSGVLYDQKVIISFELRGLIETLVRSHITIKRKDRVI
jgi:hypothetical protein